MTDETLIAALISNPSIRAAAKAAECSESAVYKKLRDKEFKAKYDKVRHMFLEEATCALQGQISGAVDTLVAIMKDPTASQQTRLNAAESIIRNCLKMTEQVEVLSRLDALENRNNE